MRLTDQQVRQRILIVDDNPRNLELLRSVLEDDVDIVAAEDGETALALVASPDIDLVLLDVMMPGLTGYDVSRRIRELRGGEYLPVLMLTSLSAVAERVAGFEAGADDFITKPINTHELRLRVRAFLRTRQLDRERRALLEDLQRLHDLKDDLSALLVHDLRNPLAGLLANLHLLADEPLTPDAQESVDAALLATTRLSEMVDDLLQVRMLEDGALQVRLEPLRVGDVVADAVRTMAGAARERRMGIDQDLSEPISVHGEATLLRRAIENLLANSIRHATPGHAICVCVRRQGDHAEISVQDSGPGIPPEQRPLLFSKYGTSELRRTGRRSGHGLGLYLVSLVMRAHAGSAHVDDTFDLGTRVILRLPLGDPA